MKFPKSTVLLLSLFSTLPFAVKAQVCDTFTYQGTGSRPITSIDDWVSTTDGATLTVFCTANNCCKDTDTDTVVVFNPNSSIRILGNCGYRWNQGGTYKICQDTCNYDATDSTYGGTSPACANIGQEMDSTSASPLVIIESGSCNGWLACFGIADNLLCIQYIRVAENSCKDGYGACWGIGGRQGDRTDRTSVETIEIGSASCTGMLACNFIGRHYEPYPFPLRRIKVDNGSCNGPGTCQNIGNGNTGVEKIEIGCNTCGPNPSSSPPGPPPCASYGMSSSNNIVSTWTPGALLGTLCTSYDPRHNSCPAPAPTDPCTNKNCNNAGKCTVVDGSASCICENTFEVTVNGDGCVCPVGTTLDIPSNRCFAPPTISPTSVEPSRSPVVVDVKTSAPTSVRSLPTPSPVVDLNDNCEDNNLFEFILDMSEQFVKCEWLTQNKKRSDVRTTRYCDKDDVQGACQSSCGNCQCGDDKGFTFNTPNTKKVVDCSYITQNWKRVIARRNKLCYTDNDCREASTIGRACAAACGFCDASSTSSCTRSNAPTSFPTQTLVKTKSPIASPPVPAPSKGYLLPTKSPSIAGPDVPAPTSAPGPSKGKGYGTSSPGPSKGKGYGTSAPGPSKGKGYGTSAPGPSVTSPTKGGSSSKGSDNPSKGYNY